MATEPQSYFPYGKQSIDARDVAAVTAALQAEFLTGGPTVAAFEEKFARAVGAKHAVAVNSATSALHLALRVAGIGPGDRVVTSPNTFVASANCAAYVGATPDFSDIHPVSYNLDPRALAQGWLADTRAVVAVDYAGQPCDLPAIAEIARARGAVVIEDACHAVGSAFAHDGREWQVGGHPWADATVFSFHPVKVMTTMEGGMYVTDNAAWAAQARRLRSHGLDRQNFVGLGTGVAALDERGPWYYEMQELGYNYRLTDVQCALGLAQLERLGEFCARRRELVAEYNHLLQGVSWLRTPGTLPHVLPDKTGWHLYTVWIDFERIGRSRTEVMQRLRAAGIGSQVLYIPVYLQPWYQRTYGYRVGKCPAAEHYYRGALSLPLYPEMALSDVQRVAAVLQEIGGGA